MKKLILAATAAATMAGSAQAIDYSHSASIVYMGPLTEAANNCFKKHKNGNINDFQHCFNTSNERADVLNRMYDLGDTVGEQRARGDKFKAERDLARDQLNSVVDVAKSQKHEINAMKAYIRTVFNRYGWMVGFPTPPNL